ncbi:hypothetical protein M378DRAFT_9499 [Amanita muscaria Koide BX008]|uniref:Uncharacterized protein n=1 Tax=Amanita muscaria (strain Koide BX008) TaxID=946122 RepID=A0A0C2SUZ5_AMAMK|nr:hypothetical protein M378DRAFT_9499 [Amanita muscaria Koide BX008]
MPQPPTVQAEGITTGAVEAESYEYPSIVEWLNHCDQHPQRCNRNLGRYAPAFDDEGFVSIDQLVGPRISIEKLAEWLKLGRGTADLIIRYAEQDILLIKAIALICRTNNTSNNHTSMVNARATRQTLSPSATQMPQTSMRGNSIRPSNLCPPSTFQPVFQPLRPAARPRTRKDLIPSLTPDSLPKSVNELLDSSLEVGCARCGGVVEIPTSRASPDSDGDPSFKRVVQALLDDDENDTFSFPIPTEAANNSYGPSVLPPTGPLPTASSEASSASVFRVHIIDEDENHIGTLCVSERECTSGFDFTGELKKLDESVGSDSKSFVEQDDLVKLNMSTSTSSSNRLNGELNASFKFGGRPKPQASPVKSEKDKLLTLSDIIPPIAKTGAVPQPQSRLNSNVSSKRKTHMTARSFLAQSRPTSMISFTGLDLFEEIHQTFAFCGPRPALYPPTSNSNHRQRDPVLSIASVSSYGWVTNPGINDPFGFSLSQLQEWPSSEEISATTFLFSVDDTFSFLHHPSRRIRVDSNTSSTSKSSNGPNDVLSRRDQVGHRNTAEICSESEHDDRTMAKGFLVSSRSHAVLLRRVTFSFTPFSSSQLPTINCSAS